MIGNDGVVHDDVSRQCPENDDSYDRLRLTRAADRTERNNAISKEFVRENQWMAFSGPRFK